MRLNIGPLTIELSGVTEQEIPVNSRLFLDRKPADKRADRHYTFHFVGRLPLPSNDWQAIFRRNDIVIFRKEERETRLLAIGNLNACYALYQEKDERNADIYFIEGLKRELQTDTLFISCLCLERPLSARGMLHTALCLSGLSWASHPVQRSQRHWQINTCRPVVPAYSRHPGTQWRPCPALSCSKRRLRDNGMACMRFQRYLPQ